MATINQGDNEIRPINYIIWMGLFFIAALAAAAAKFYPYFPGDVELERWVQSIFLPDLNWAAMVSRSAEFP